MNRQPETTGTATLEAARQHARSQATAAPDTVRTIPSWTAIDLPDGVDPATVIWDETVGPGQYTARRLPRDSVLRITDIEGDACTQLLLFNAHRTSERLNPADTVKVQWQAYLGPKAVLLSDMGRVLMTIISDTSARHDCLCGGSNRALNDAKFGDGSVGGHAPNARDLLALGGAKYGLSRVDIGPCVNLFKSVRIAADGAMTFDGPSSPRGHVELRAEMDLLVLLANTPHRLDDRSAYTVTPIRVTARRAARPTNDPLRTTTPERERAFQNTDELLLEVTP